MAAQSMHMNAYAAQHHVFLYPNKIAALKMTQQAHTSHGPVSKAEKGVTAQQRKTLCHGPAPKAKGMSRLSKEKTNTLTASP